MKTKLDLEKGQKLRITATGQVNVSNYSVSSIPDGVRHLDLVLLKTDTFVQPAGFPILFDCNGRFKSWTRRFHHRPVDPSP